MKHGIIWACHLSDSEVMTFSPSCCVTFGSKYQEGDGQKNHLEALKQSLKKTMGDVTEVLSTCYPFSRDTIMFSSLRL